MLELYEGIITITARTFANRNLAASVDPKNLGQLHKTASPGSLGNFRLGLDRHRYEELRTSLVIKLLDDAQKQRPIKDNPFKWAKTVAWNHCRDLEAKEKANYKRCPPKPTRAKRSGNPEDDIIEAAPNQGAYFPDRVEMPGEGSPEEDLDLKGRDLLRVLDRKSFGDLEEFYRQAFPSEEFRTSVEASLYIIDAIYAFKRQLADPDRLMYGGVRNLA